MKIPVSLADQRRSSFSYNQNAVQHRNLNPIDSCFVLELTPACSGLTWHSTILTSATRRRYFIDATSKAKGICVGSEA